MSCLVEGQAIVYFQVLCENRGESIGDIDDDAVKSDCDVDLLVNSKNLLLLLLIKAFNDGH